MKPLDCITFGIDEDTKCSQCGEELTKDDRRVFRLSTMNDPWCGACITLANKRHMEKHLAAGGGFLHRELPEYLRGWGK